MRSLIMGIFMVAGGASGKLVLMGTNSNTALVIVGVVVAAFGLFQLLTANKPSPELVKADVPADKQ
jgi:uncharacterized membrane protein YfcA